MNPTENSLRIAFFSALPWEYGPFRRSLGPWKPFSIKPFKAFITSRGEKDLLLVETGMGKTMVEMAMSWAFWSWTPHLLVSFGFAGGISCSAGVGDVFLCNEFHHFDSDARTLSPPPYRVEPRHEILSCCRIQGVNAARCITTLRLEPKGFITPFAGHIPTLVDMESYFAARFAAEHRLPLLCFRSVSDACDQDLGYALTDISDTQGRVDLRRVFGTIVRNPAVIHDFMASWKRSHRAARNLSRLLTAVAGLPDSRIRALLGPGVWWPEPDPSHSPVHPGADNVIDSMGRS